MSEEEKQQLEANYTFERTTELALFPVEGSFNAEHLREINRRIFQDLPRLGFSDVTPGEFRPAVPPGHDWVKLRTLESVKATSQIAYSQMDDEVTTRLDKLLHSVDPETLSKLKTGQFTRTLAHLYAELDYIHPFRDGNSRTLRVFTRQLAAEAGYSVKWERLNQSPAGRDLLYIARDLRVNTIALPFIQDDGVKKRITFALTKLGQNRTLQELLGDVVEPRREICLEQKQGRSRSQERKI